MYDRQTETWWQQATGEGIAGDLAGKQLTFLPVSITSWEDFLTAFPDGDVLSRDSFTSSMGNFLSYSLGMGAIILIVTTGTAFFRRVMSRWLRKVVPHIQRVSALFLIGAGGYLLSLLGFYSGAINRIQLIVIRGQTELTSITSSVILMIWVCFDLSLWFGDSLIGMG